MQIVISKRKNLQSFKLLYLWRQRIEAVPIQCQVLQIYQLQDLCGKYRKRVVGKIQEFQ